MMDWTVLYFLHTTMCLFLTGLIWTIQVVHYPLFEKVSAESFPAYHEDHTKRIGALVAPTMGIELLTALGLLIQPPAGVQTFWLWANGGLLLGIWAQTAFIAMPCHRKLAKGWNRATIHQLVWTNWIRTVLWTTRSALLVWLLWIER